MKKKKTFPIGTGITSLLMIFVVLCLTTFGILSYTSANAEVALTKKNSDYVLAYYDAYSKGSVVLANIDNIIFNASNIEDNNTYYDTIRKKVTALNMDGCGFEFKLEDKGMIIDIFIDITNKQQMFTSIKVNSQTDTQRYNVLCNYLKSEYGDEAYEEELPDMWGE